MKRSNQRAKIVGWR